MDSSVDYMKDYLVFTLPKLTGPIILPLFIIFV